MSYWFNYISSHLFIHFCRDIHLNSGFGCFRWQRIFQTGFFLIWKNTFSWKFRNLYITIFQFNIFIWNIGQVISLKVGLLFIRQVNFILYNHLVFFLLSWAVILFEHEYHCEVFLPVRSLTILSYNFFGTFDRWSLALLPWHQNCRR